MNSTTEVLFTISQIISVLSTIIICVAAIILFAKKKTLATSIILVSNIIILLSSFSRVIVNFVINQNNVDNFMKFQAISSVVQNLAYLFFAIGLIILAVSDFSKNKTLK